MERIYNSSDDYYLTRSDGTECTFVDFTKPINIKGECHIKLQFYENKSNNTCYCDLIKYYWFLFEDSYEHNIMVYPKISLMYDDVTYYITQKIYINGNYIIGPDSTLPDVTIPQKCILDDYYCNIKDGRILISTSSKDNYPCKDGVLNLVIKHNQPNGIIVNRHDKNMFNLVEELLNYHLPITII
jgi:hypothetical protein